MSESMLSSGRRWSRGRLAVIALAGFFVLFTAAWTTADSGGLIIGAGPEGEGCRLFWAEAPDSVGWSPGGEFLAVSTHNADGYDDGNPGVRVFRWPGMALVSHAKQAFAYTFSIDDSGVLTWQSETSTVPSETIAWRMEPGRKPVVDTTHSVPATSGETRLGAALSSLGVLAQVRVPDPDSPARLCVSGA